MLTSLLGGFLLPKNMEAILRPTTEREKQSGSPFRIDSCIWDQIDPSIYGVLKEFPISVLKGTQIIGEYDEKKTRGVDKAYRYYQSAFGDPKAFIEACPPLVCSVANPMTREVFVMILNGHHRIRRAGKFGLSTVSAYEFTPTIATRYYNDAYPNVPMTVDQFTQTLLRWTDEAQESFERVTHKPYPTSVNFDSYRRFREAVVWR